MPPSPVGFSDKSNSFFHSELKGTNAMFKFLSLYKGSMKKERVYARNSPYHFAVLRSCFVVYSSFPSIFFISPFLNS